MKAQIFFFFMLGLWFAVLIYLLAENNRVLVESVRVLKSIEIQVSAPPVLNYYDDGK